MIPSGRKPNMNIIGHKTCSKGDKSDLSWLVPLVPLILKMVGSSDMKRPISTIIVQTRRALLTPAEKERDNQREMIARDPVR